MRTRAACRGVVGALPAALALACADAATRPTPSFDPSLPVVLTGGAPRITGAARAARAPSVADADRPEVVAVTDISPPGSVASRAADINAAGQVAGTADVVVRDSLSSRAFVWDAASGATYLGALFGGWTEATAVNARGQVVGASEPGTFPSGRSHAFLWEAGVGMRDLGTLPGYRFARASDVNGVGQVVGFTGYESGPLPHPFVWDAVTGMRDLGTLNGGLDAYATAINDAGQVVGYAAAGPPPNNPSRAFLWERSRGMRGLGTLGGVYSAAFDVNDAGQVVGSSSIDVGPGERHHAFLWERGTGMLDLGTLPGDRGSAAHGVNNAGQVVGVSVRDVCVGEGDDFSCTERVRPFVWDRTVGMRALPALPLGDGQGGAFAINDAGQIAGHGGRADGASRAVVWTLRVEGAPVVDRVLAGVLAPGVYAAYAPDGGVWLRVRLRDTDDPGPWTWWIDWGDGVVHTPTVAIKGEFAFVRATPYAEPGPHAVTAAATDPGEHASPAATARVP